MENKFVFVKDLLEYSDTFTDEKGNTFGVVAYGKVEDVEWLAPGMIKNVRVTQILNVQNYVNGGTGFPVERNYTNNTLPEEIRIQINISKTGY